MRLATLILGIALGLLLWLLTLIAQVADGDELTADGAEGWSVATFWLLPLCWLVAVAFVTHWPVIAAIAFTTAAGLSFAAILQVDAATTYGGTMALWLLASLVLTVFSILGWLGKRRSAQRSQPQQSS